MINDIFGLVSAILVFVFHVLYLYALLSPFFYPLKILVEFFVFLFSFSISTGVLEQIQTLTPS